MILVALAIGPGALLAEPTLEAVVTDLGGGLYGAEVWVHSNDGMDLSFFADIAFTGEQAEPICLPGEIQQMKAFGVVVVDTNEYAALYDGLGDPPYDMWRDSWFYMPWAAGAWGIQEAPNYYSIEGGTGTIAYYESLALVYLCMTGDMAYEGYITRGGVQYPMAGIFCIPEPATPALLAIGAVALIRRRRR